MNKQTTKPKVKEQEEARKRAEGKIHLAIERMLEKYPFHTSVLNKMILVCQPSVGTMGVTYGGEDVLLLHNPKFVLEIPLKQLVGVLLHEVHHVIFNHLLMKPEDYPHRAALVIAQEVTVNEFITEPLPEGVYLLKNFPDLPPLESTKQRYKRLEKSIPKATAIITVDNHGVWEIETYGSGAEERIQEILQEAAGGVDPGKIINGILEELESRGIYPGSEVESIAGGKGKTPWQQLLRHYTGQVLQIKPTYMRPPRRFPSMVGILPGSARQGHKPKVMAVMDTSGSITAKLLSKIEGELRNLAQNYNVTVVECDAKIQRTYPYRKIKSVWGRGGTDLCPPFEKKFLRKHNPDLLIYFTDGYGPAPSKPPDFPVIWAVLPDGKMPAKWGRELHIQ